MILGSRSLQAFGSAEQRAERAGGERAESRRRAGGERAESGQQLQFQLLIFRAMPWTDGHGRGRKEKRNFFRLTIQICPKAHRAGSVDLALAPASHEVLASESSRRAIREPVLTSVTVSRAPCRAPRELDRMGRASMLRVPRAPRPCRP